MVQKKATIRNAYSEHARRTPKRPGVVDTRQELMKRKTELYHAYHAYRGVIEYRCPRWCNIELDENDTVCMRLWDEQEDVRKEYEACATLLQEAYKWVDVVWSEAGDDL
jgi:hypothetical protein